MSDREIDAAIAEHVMGWHNADDYWIGHFGNMVQPLSWSPSTDISAAWEVLGTLQTTWDHTIYNGDNLRYCRLDHRACPATEPSHSAHATTAPMAICLAALKAVGVEV